MLNRAHPPPNPYWMRAVSFAGLHRLLKAVGEAPDGLRARELNALVLARRVILTERDSLPRPTTLYHYRNTLIRLGVLTRAGRRLHVNVDDPNVGALLDEPAPAPGVKFLGGRAREHFAAVVFGNRDCRALFFDLFRPSVGSWASVTDFRERGAPVSWTRETQASGRHVVFRNRATGRTVCHTARTAAHAVLYGLRYWVRDELALVDEYCGQTMDRTTLFPVARAPVSSAEERAAVLDAVRYLLAQRNRSTTGEWTMLSVAALIAEYCQTQRRPRAVLFGAMDWLRREWPGHTHFAPTPLGLATIAAVSPAQENLVLRRYYKPTGGPYVSHFSFHREVTTDLREARRHHV